MLLKWNIRVHVRALMMILVDVELNVELHLFFWYFMAVSTDINVEGIPPPTCLESHLQLSPIFLEMNISRNIHNG